MPAVDQCKGWRSCAKTRRLNSICPPPSMRIPLCWQESCSCRFISQTSLDAPHSRTVLQMSTVPIVPLREPARTSPESCPCQGCDTKARRGPATICRPAACLCAFSKVRAVRKSFIIFRLSVRLLARLRHFSLPPARQHDRHPHLGFSTRLSRGARLSANNLSALLI